MSFKKDYINFVLNSVLNSPDITSGPYGESGFSRSGSVGMLLEKIISTSDFVKITYLVGKTAGLELLFKYLIYISDKIDKSQITIFNLKNNFDYDVQNLKRICSKIEEYKSTAVTGTEAPSTEGEESGEKESAAEEAPEAVMSTIKAEADEQVVEEISAVSEDKETAASETEVVQEESVSDSSFTLVDHQEESVSADSEVFELPDINQPPEIEEPEIIDKTPEVTAPAPEPVESEEQGEEAAALDEGVGVKQVPDEGLERKEAEETMKSAGEIAEPFEFEVRPPEELERTETGIVIEASEENSLEKLRSKFFEEIKILEKLMFHIEKDLKGIKSGKVKPSVSRRLSEITEISGELSQTTKLLGMDDISSIFFSISLYFAKVTETPGIITLNNLRLLLSSLDLVIITLKGEKYSNYKQMMQKVDNLRNNLSLKPEVKQEPAPEEEKHVACKDEHPVSSGAEQPVLSKAEPPSERKPVAKELEYPKHFVEVPDNKEPQPSVQEAKSVPELDSANFKMRYIVKEFEKNFLDLNEINGEYSKFDVLEKIDELNNLLRMVARISSSAGFRDILKLAEVSYVFLKYLKDYRMNVLDPEIQQIVKYIIFSFKMLLTNRKPEDFDILVQYLNNPVKIFTDS